MIKRLVKGAVLRVATSVLRRPIVAAALRRTLLLTAGRVPFLRARLAGLMHQARTRVVYVRTPQPGDGLSPRSLQMLRALRNAGPAAAAPLRADIVALLAPAGVADASHLPAAWQALASAP